MAVLAKLLVSPEAPLLGELSSGCETERIIRRACMAAQTNFIDIATIWLHAVLLTAGNNDCVHLFHSFSLYSLVVKASPHRAVSGAHTMRLE